MLYTKVNRLLDECHRYKVNTRTLTVSLCLAAAIKKQRSPHHSTAQSSRFSVAINRTITGSNSTTRTQREQSVAKLLTVAQNVCKICLLFAWKFINKSTYSRANKPSAGKLTAIIKVYKHAYSSQHTRPFGYQQLQISTFVRKGLVCKDVYITLNH